MLDLGIEPKTSSVAVVLRTTRLTRENIIFNITLFFVMLKSADWLFRCDCGDLHWDCKQIEVVFLFQNWRQCPKRFCNPNENRVGTWKYWYSVVLCSRLIAMGNLSGAAQVLAKSQDQDCLSLAADIAKVAGRTTFANQVQKKANQSKSQTSYEKTLKKYWELPSKIELLLKANKGHASDDLESDMKRNLEMWSIEWWY